MTDVVDDNTNDVNVAEQPEVKEIDYKAWYEQNQEKIKSFDAVVAKKDELLKETKKAKADKQAADAETARMAEEKAHKDGEFEKLWKTAKQREDDLAKELQNIKNANRQDRIQNAALTIASKLAEGDNVELLSDFVSRNLDKLADETGALSADVFEEVAKDFANNVKYKSLMRDSKSSGGSAPGNVRGAQSSSKEVDRAAFAKLKPEQQMKHITSGGTVTD